MSDSEQSSRGKRHERSASNEKPKTTKLFITNLDGKADTKELEDELRTLFENYGHVESIMAKRNRNAEYCFAFAEMKDYAAAQECVKAYDKSSLGGKQIKVEFQDDGKRRKDSNKGCYNCGKMGHFARECQSARNDSRSYRRHSRSRSRSESERRHKSKRRHRDRSGSSGRVRSRSPKSKKERKNRSRDREEKRKKKHKRSHSSS